MGTDINMIAEVRRNGVWELSTAKVFKNPYYDPASDKKLAIEEYMSKPDDSRNYNLFAILAGVRNGEGFAGCRIGERFNPISELKGYPDDMSKNNVLFGDEYGYGSWLTLRELHEYDWEQLHRKYGYVDETTYRDYIMKGEQPNSYSGDIWGRNIVKLTEPEMVDLINDEYPRDESKRYYTACYFAPITYRECADWFYDETMEGLRRLIPDGGTEDDVRIVFEFDC